jgi:parvulin-like peptidyl-prolyl isomerase
MQGRYAQVSQTLFGLPEGAASDVIDTGDAYFIVKAGRVQPAQRRPFTEVQPELAERYRAARFASLRQQLLEKLLSQAVIEPDEGPFLQALVEAAPSHAEMLAQPSSPP